MANDHNFKVKNGLDVGGSATIGGSLTINGSISGSIDYSDITNPPVIDNSVDYINSASFNTSNGILTLSGIGRAGATVDLDNRYLTSYTETDTLATVCARGNTTNQDIIISKASARLRLHEPNSSDQNYPSLEFDTDNNQGVALSFNEFDSQLPLSGYGLVLGPSTTNAQFPTVGSLSLNVLGEIYAGGATLSSLHKVWHAGNFTPSDYLLTSNYEDNYVDSVTFNTSTGVLTLGRTGSLPDLTVDLDGKYAESNHVHSQYMLKYNGASTADYDTLLTNGIWRNQGGLNGPEGTTHSTGLVALQDNSTYGFQLFSDTVTNASPDMYFRNKSTVWGSWNKLWHSNNLNPVTGLAHDTVNTELDVTFADGTTQSLDLSQYIDDTNLSRIVSGAHVGSGIVRFTRDDSTTFNVDFSDFFDDTNLARIVSASWNTSNGVLTLTRNDSTAINVDLDNRYLTGYTETDTLQSVTTRGNTTTQTMIIKESNVGGFEYRTADGWGSWARHTHSISTGGGTHLYAFGGRGSNGTSLSYAYLGKAYNDMNIRLYPDGETQLYCDNSKKFSTKTSGVEVLGNLTFDGAVTTTSQDLGIEWTGFDKEGTTDFSDNAYIKHVTNVGGLSGSVLEIKSMNDASDGVAFTTNSNTGVRINGNTVFNEAYHPNADKWTTARSHTVTLTGDVTGSATQSVDGTGNKTWTLSTAVVNNSHDHNYLEEAGTITNLNDAWTVRGTSEDGGLQVFRYQNTASNMPVGGNNANWLMNIYSHAGSSGNYPYGRQFAGADNEDFYTRKVTNGGFGAWRKIWTTAHFDITNYDTRTISDGRYVRKTGDTMSGQLTVNADVVVTGDLKMNGSDSYIWTPNTSAGYTGFWDQANARTAMRYRNNLGGWGIMGNPESGHALKVHGNFKVTGNTYLGDANGDATYINDILRVRATDSGTSEFWFGEATSNTAHYGSKWYWDSAYTHFWKSVNAGTETNLMWYATNDLTYVNWGRSFNMGNKDINYVRQLHFNDNVRFYDEDNDNYLNFKWGDAGAGGIKFRDGDSALHGYVYGNGTGQFGLLNGAGEWAVRIENNGLTELRYNNSAKLETTSTGVSVAGLLTATTKSFTIDHPTKEGHKLRYGSLEGPENGVYVRGRLKDSNVIELPDVWVGLVHEDSITVSLTAIGKSQEIWVEDIMENKVIVGGDNVNCFYHVFAERKDVDKLITEFKEVE